MIKFAKRRNLIYAMMFVIFNFLRKADSIVMKNYIGFSGSLILTSLMFIADFISGLIVYLYNLKYLKEKEASKFMGIVILKYLYLYFLHLLLILQNIFFHLIIFQ